MTQTLNYLHGFGNHFSSEALPNALVKGRNSPQTHPLGLYAEQISGSSFPTPRQDNLHTWFYRIRPSVLQSEFEIYPQSNLMAPPFAAELTPPTAMRWNPMPYAEKRQHFIDSLTTFAGTGSLQMHTGSAIHLYAATTSMDHDYFYNADGEFLIVPQEGECRFKTECGIIDVKPGEIIVIPRGIKFQVQLLSEKARGYVCENFGAPLRLPNLGIIGANGLANANDFCIPEAAFEERDGKFRLLAKFQGHLWQSRIRHSPLDVVAWHGTYAPYKYDLSLFNTINTVSFDHPDPSIFTVLTSPSTVSHVANVDFVIFPPRWVVAEDTFRPPYFHRNIMSEFMGLISGTYDAKESGFVPGGCSLHNCMTAHGPDAAVYQKATMKDLKPEYYANTMAFMFESNQVYQLTPAAFHADFRQKDYLACWQGLVANFQLESTR